MTDKHTLLFYDNQNNPVFIDIELHELQNLLMYNAYYIYENNEYTGMQITYLLNNLHDKDYIIAEPILMDFIKEKLEYEKESV